MRLRHPGSLPPHVAAALAVLATLFGPGARHAAADPGTAPRPWTLLAPERPDDPPLPSAPRIGIPAARPRVGQFLSVQVNLGFNGLNIVGDAANEPSMAVDLTNPNRIAIGWRQFDDVGSNFRQAGWAWSADAGRTWRRGGKLDPGNFRSDPVLAAGPNGRFYYSSLSGDFTCDIFVSLTGGVSWIGPFDAWGGDKQWITVDRTGGVGRGNIYSAWSRLASCCGNNTFTRSVDSGINFSIPVPIPSSPALGAMDVGPDGAVYVAGVDAHTQTAVVVAKSTTAQTGEFIPGFDFVVAVDLGGSVEAQLGAESPNPEGLLGQVWVAADPSSGPTAGNIYVLCSVDPPGDDPMDVMFSRSADGGKTWSLPVRVNDVADGWQWNGTMSVAPNGRIDVVWNDTRGTGSVNRSSLHYASSTDGGRTWSPIVRLSPEWDSHVGWPNQAKIGDYYHMISDRVGASLAWAATFNGEQDVWFMRIGDFDCNGNGVGDVTDIALGTSMDANRNQIPDECDAPTSEPEIAGRVTMHPNAPNPFNPTTTIPVDVPDGGAQVRLVILDVAGRVVRTLGGVLPAGRNALAWDGRDARGQPVASGVYMCRLDAPGSSATQRLVLAR